MPVIRETGRRCLEHQVRAGRLPATSGGAIDELARAVHDQRYELGPVTPYLRDPHWKHRYQRVRRGLGELAYAAA